MTLFEKDQIKEATGGSRRACLAASGESHVRAARSCSDQIMIHPPSAYKALSGLKTKTGATERHEMALKLMLRCSWLVLGRGVGWGEGRGAEEKREDVLVLTDAQY